MYVTYGFPKVEFNKDKIFIDVKNHNLSKPASAWWGSPEDAEWGWKDWCLSEDWIPGELTIDEYFSEENTIRWRLTEGTKKIDIYTEQDLYDLMERGYIYEDKDSGIYFKYLRFDYVKMLEDGYKAVELFDSRMGHGACRNLEFESMMNSWDCDSIVVLDPSVIEVID